MGAPAVVGRRLGWGESNCEMVLSRLFGFRAQKQEATVSFWVSGSLRFPFCLVRQQAVSFVLQWPEVKSKWTRCEKRDSKKIEVKPMWHESDIGERSK